MSRVVIVMRTYERPVLLARALASVASQTHRDRHLVIVNNGGDPAVVERVVGASGLAGSGGSHETIHLEVRTGMEAASNRALASATGDYFAVHDDDDVWHPEFLAVTTARLAAEPGAAAVITGLTKVIETMKGDKVWPVREEPFWLNEGRLTFRGMIGANTFPPVAALFRSSLLATVGMFDESLPVLGDWEFNVRAVRAGRFVYEPRVLARYHVRTPDSDRTVANSIVDGESLHRSTKLLLQDRWLTETVDGVNKGLLSLQAQAAGDAEEALRHGGPRVADTDIDAVASRVVSIMATSRLHRRLWRGVRRPAHGLRAVRRMITGRG